MLKAYFLKEDPLWFAFWGLLTAAERGVLCEVPACRGSEWKQSSWGCRASASRRGERGWSKSDTPLYYCFPLLRAAAHVVGATYDTAPNYRVLLLLWHAVP